MNHPLGRVEMDRVDSVTGEALEKDRLDRLVAGPLLERVGRCGVLQRDELEDLVDERTDPGASGEGVVSHGKGVGVRFGRIGEVRRGSGRHLLPLDPGEGGEKRSGRAAPEFGPAIGDPPGLGEVGRRFVRAIGTWGSGS